MSDMQIKYIAQDGVPDLFNRKQCVFVLDSRPQIRDAISSIEERLKSTHLTYNVHVHHSIGKISLADYIGGDVLCPLFDYNGNLRGYIIGLLGSESIVDLVDSVVKRAVLNHRDYLEDLLLSAAFNNPIEFNSSIDSAFNENKDLTQNSSKRSKRPFNVFGVPMLHFGAAALGLDIDLGIDFDLNLDTIDGIAETSYVGDFDSADSAVSPVRYLNTNDISNKNKREFLKNIPDKVSERYIKKNPNCRKDLEKLISSVSYDDLQELVLELITRQKKAIQIFDFSKLSAASEYEIHVKKWDRSITSFDYKFQYCVFIKDIKGTEYPIKFMHHPAYCLYIMYIIDRAVRGDDASYLSLRKNREQFIRLYQTVFGETYENAEKKYLTFSYRLTKEGEPSRKGRYDDYIKDIDDTITSIVGRADSIPLKLRDGGHLEILPEKIIIDEKLRSFKFK